MFLDNTYKIFFYLMVPLALTILIEGAIILVLFRKWVYVYYTLLLNVLTNPLLNFIMLLYFSYIGMSGYYILLYALEIVVVFVEGWLLHKLTDIKTGKALLVSLLLNGGSYLVGVLVL